MEMYCKIEHNVRLRMGDGLLLLGVFANSLLMIILGYDMWKSMLFCKDWRIIISILLMLLVALFLLYFLDKAIWRIFGVECVVINSQGILYVKKGRLIKQKTFIKTEDVISITKNKVKKKFATTNIEEDKGKVQIVFMRKIICFRLLDQIDIGSQFSDMQIDKLLSAYSNLKASECDG